MSEQNSKRLRAPDDSHRMMIVGQNGTGKTVAGVALLSVRSYDKMPWIIANYKGDEYLDQIPGVRELNPNAPLPTEAGLYMTRPAPEDGSLDPLLAQAYRRGGGVGFYIDEGTMVGQHSKPFRNVLTQGRSLRIPVIMLSQRPVWLSKYAFTESNFFLTFPLIDVKDRAHMTGWVKGLDVNYDETLEEYQSYYFDAGRRGSLRRFEPFPFGDEILDRFDRRRPRRLKRH